jgi:hypothetical protein
VAYIVGVTEFLATVSGDIMTGVQVVIEPRTVVVEVSSGPVYIGGSNFSAASGGGSPVGVVTPSFVGQLYFDTLNDQVYAAPTLSSGDWFEIVRNY